MRLFTTTTHVVHARWGTTPFPRRCQTAPEQDFRWTVVRTRGLDNCLTLIFWNFSCGVTEIVSCVQCRSVTSLCYSNEQRTSVKSVKRLEWSQEVWTECAPPCAVELKLVLKICCRDHTNIAHISARTVFWTCVHCEWLLILVSTYTPLKLVNIF
jgi:hypothetical protein